jgi:hypothetical protein
VPLPVRTESERRLKALKIRLQALENSGTTDLEKKRQKKYQQLKFIELQKVNKAIRRLEKKLQQQSALDEATLEATREEFKQARIHQAYIQRYPAAEKYVALFPQEKDEPGSKTYKKRQQLLQAAHDHLYATPKLEEEVGEIAEQDDDDFFDL